MDLKKQKWTVLRYIVGCVVIITAMQLTGCAGLCGGEGRSDCQQMNGTCAHLPLPRERKIALMEWRLQQEGVQIIHVGEVVKYVISADEMFYPDSANIHPGYRRVLNCISNLIGLYDKVVVKVAAYTDNYGNPVRRRALTVKQAETIVRYVWPRDIDARLIYAEGYGSERPVAINNCEWGRAQNRRIEITFRHYPRELE